MTTKRQKLQAMADQTASPEEAAVARAMLAKTAATPEERLEVIATDIKAEYGKGVEAQFAIGRLLMEAREQFPGPSQDKAFGAWLTAQNFPFGQSYAWRLRAAAEREPEVRAYLAASNASRTGKPGPELGPATAIAYMNAKPKPTGEAIPVTDTTPVDPAYAALRQAYKLIVEGGAFESMHVDDLSKCASFIKGLATAYNEAKASRGG